MLLAKSFLICKDTGMYAYLKQHESKRDSKGAFYAIHSRWLDPNHVKTKTSKAKAVLKALMYNEERNTCH